MFPPQSPFTLISVPTTPQSGDLASFLLEGQPPGQGLSMAYLLRGRLSSRSEGPCIFHSGQSVVLALRPQVPVAGRLAHFLPFWHSVTSDRWVLEVVERGHSLEVVERGHSLELLGFLRSALRPTKLPTRYVSAMADEVGTLLHKGAMVVVSPDQVHEASFPVNRRGILRAARNSVMYNSNLNMRFSSNDIG
jgi:hypothetical protein